MSDTRASGGRSSTRRRALGGIFTTCLTTCLTAAASAIDFRDQGSYVVEAEWPTSGLALRAGIGGIFFSSDGETLFVSSGAEWGERGTVAALSVERNDAGEVVGLGLAKLVLEGLPDCFGIEDADFGPDGTLFYAPTWKTALVQRTGGFEGEERVFDTGPLGFQAIGFGFSPHIVDPASGAALLQVSQHGGDSAREASIYDVPLVPQGGGFFEPRKAQLFARVPITRREAWGLHYIPSGPDAGSLLYADGWGDVLWILAIDPVTGHPIDDESGLPGLGTMNPRVVPFASGFPQATGDVTFDPITNDLFVTTKNWPPTQESIIRISGFPPPAERPLARFVMDPEVGVAPLEVRFDAGDSEAPEGRSIASRRWHFGDGRVSEDTRATHTYAAAGRYLIAHSVTDDAGRMAWARKLLEVHPARDVSPWISEDLGQPSFPGGARFDVGSDERTLVIYAGGERSRARDQFHYVYQELEGDFVLTARVTEEKGVGTVGAMIRESLEPAARSLALYLEDSGLLTGDVFRAEYRDTRVHRTRGGPYEFPNAWVQLERVGDELVARSSTDGAEWVELRRDTVDFPPTAFAGIVATGDDTRQYAPYEPFVIRVQNLEMVVQVSTHRFRRGDCNDDGTVNITDAACILNWLFAGQADPGCVAATNLNGDDSANITDATYLLNHLFAGGPAPVAPFPECGPGMLPQELSCANPPDCQ